MGKPLISVMMPTYNNAKYIKQAIESIYAQNYDNIEIIVVDDGSTDNTKEIVQQYKDIKYFYIEHKGIPFARNTALEKSTGEYIAFLDSDDYWLPNKLNTQIQYFKDHPDCEIVFTKYENFFENEYVKKNKIAIFEKTSEKNNNSCLETSVVKKRVFDKCGKYNESLEFGEDTEYEYRISKNNINIKHIINKIFYMRRLHGKNISLKRNIGLMKNFLRKFSNTLRQGIKK